MTLDRQVVAALERGKEVSNQVKEVSKQVNKKFKAPLEREGFFKPEIRLFSNLGWVFAFVNYPDDYRVDVHLFHLARNLLPSLNCLHHLSVKCHQPAELLLARNIL